MRRALAVAYLILSGCFLTNINNDDCAEDSECGDAFGFGSACVEGFCSEPQGCVTGHDCRIAFGGGACVDGSCVDTLPDDPMGACTLVEPDDLTTRNLIGEGSPLIVGGLFQVDDSSDKRRANAVRLGVREINEVGGLNEGRQIAMVICDNGGPDNALVGDERRARIEGVVDYLAGTLGVPYIVGPATSSDSITTVNYILSKGYPTALISPSATSPALTSQPDRLDQEDEFGLFWRTAPSDALQGQVLANAVVGSFPTPDATLQKVSVMFISDAYGEGLANVFQSTWGAQDTVLHPFDQDVDFASVVGQVASDSPDGIMIIAIDAARTVGLLTEIAAIPALATLPVFLTDGSKDAEALLDPQLPMGVQTIIFNTLVGTAPASPQGEANNIFVANYLAAFMEDPTGFSFTANAYDGLYVGAAAVVFASQNGNNNYDGRTVAAGLARLSDASTPLPINKTGWTAIKDGLISGPLTINVIGVSGELDFDATVGEAEAPIEVWQPSNSAALCSSGPPCLVQISVQ
jgi:ABC-type branched-subunit amino acid transport system substrate-binding protein